MAETNLICPRIYIVLEVLGRSFRFVHRFSKAEVVSFRLSLTSKKLKFAVKLCHLVLE